jgi:type II secretory ATPase GspE/PulE/Tfp pilus assembly ATPase PilB-like protein
MKIDYPFPDFQIDVRDESPEQAVATLIDFAADLNASDLFFVCNEDEVAVMVRHLGIFRQLTTLPVELGRHCMGHIKAEAGLDHAEHRRPQDGRWLHERPGKPKIDLRINTIPTLYGEDFSLRLLIRDAHLLDIDNLGLLDQERDQLLELLHSPSGLILVTGPTGSGKTTTLYAALNHLHDGERKINTIEDPIEFALSGARQAQVNHHLKVDFPELLRSVLRQAPDIIMIGEIRDSVTAATAVRAANSGHLVLATLHAPISTGAIQSMLGLGVPPHFLGESLRGVLAQQLVRTLCPECKRSFDLSHWPAIFDDVKTWLKPGEGELLYAANGCRACHMTGYAGRTGVFEVLPITPNLRRMILAGDSCQKIRENAIDHGMIEIRQAAMIKVARGQTSSEEVLRVIPSEYLGPRGAD